MRYTKLKGIPSKLSDRTTPIPKALVSLGQPQKPIRHEKTQIIIPFLDRLKSTVLVRYGEHTKRKL